MLHVLKLLIPALVPSWRFFDFIAPSPRIQYVLLNAEQSPLSTWQEFRPRPARLSFLSMLGRMLWNPVWNESLYMVSCAERIIEQPTRHSEDEILKRIMSGLHVKEMTASYLQFRLVIVSREGKSLKEEVVFHSRSQAVSSRGAA